MKILKIWLLIITFTTLCFGANAQEMQKIFDSKKTLHEKLQNDFANYPNMDEAKKQEYENDIFNLLDVNFLIKQFKIDENTTKETYEIFAPYINSHSYFIARYLPEKKYIDASILLMSGVMKYAPNDAYMETFIFLLANDGKFNEALDFYPKFLEKYDDNDVKIDFDMVKDMALVSAIKENNIELLEKLYDLKVDFNHFSNKEEMPPIFVAMFTKDREKSAKFLLEHGVDKNTTHKDRQILFNAVENYFSEEFVKYLISIGCDRNYFKDTFVSSTAYNPYMYATVFRSSFYSKELISSLKPDNYKDTKYASIYLHHKLFDELFDVIENSKNISFFEKEDSINYLSELLSIKKFEIEKLPLIQQNKRIESIKLLISKGADLGKSSFQKSSDQKSVFEKIVFNPAYDIPKDVVTFALTFSNPNKKYFIKERKTHWTPLFGAITTKNQEALEILIKNGADIYYTDETGVDAFYLAVYSGQINMADKLILAGYKPNLEPKSIKHPLAIAVLNNDIKMLEYLQTLGYDIRKELFGKKNLLEFAITNPNKDIGREKQALYIKFDMYKYLIDKFRNELNNPKEIAYHNLMLLKNGKDSFEAFKYMQQMGIDINSHNEGYSPIQFISCYDNYMIPKIELLLKQNMNINHQDKDGDTPLHQFVTNYITVQNEPKEEEEKLPMDVNSILLLAGVVQKDMKQEYLKQLKQAIKYLIDNGANTKIKNKKNKKPYDVAVDGKIGDKELLGWLKR